MWQRPYEYHCPHELLGVNASSLMSVLVFSDIWLWCGERGVHGYQYPCKRQAFVCKGDVNISDVVHSVLEQSGVESTRQEYCE
ncbi:unnamed protein product [Urochloa humidicola]